MARIRPDLLLGLVLCASACRVSGSRTARFISAVLKAGSALVAPIPEVTVSLVAASVMRAMFGNTDFERWSQARTSWHRWSDVLSVGADLMSFDSRDWIAEIKVPAAVVITAADRFVSPVGQRMLARSLAAVEVPLDGDHSVCLAQPAMFAAALVQACDFVYSGEPRRRSLLTAFIYSERVTLESTGGGLQTGSGTLAARNGSKGPAKSLSIEHKLALAVGRDESRAVRRYLEALDAEHGNGKERSPERMARRIEQIDAHLAGAEPVVKVRLIQERMELHEKLKTSRGRGMTDEIEQAFLAAANAYSARKGISYAAWREVGVADDVLRRAGIPRRR